LHYTLVALLFSFFGPQTCKKNATSRSSPQDFLAAQSL
jgi:hypothetical protein